MKKGDQVICIDGDFSAIRTDKTIPREYLDIETPRTGKKYTVRELVETELGMAVRLEEIRNQIIHHDMGGNKEPAFSLYRFRLA